MSERKLALILLITLLVATFIAAGISYGEQKYNAFTGKFETVPPDYEIKYNAFDNSFSYQDPNASIVYNPHENSFDWLPPSKQDRKIQGPDSIRPSN